MDYVSKDYKCETIEKGEKMTIQEVEIQKLKPYEKNPRNNDEAVPYVAESIKKFGFKVPIIIDKNYVIVTGHTRYKASQLLGLKKVPCIIADDLTEEQIKAFRLVDNKVTENAEWDFDLLSQELDDISSIDMGIFNFNMDDMLDEDFFEDINDNEYADTTRFEHKLKIDRQQIIMTEEEYQKLIDKLNKYVDKNGVSFGFVNYLIGGADD